MEHIKIHHDENGKVDGVLVSVNDFDFVVALNDSFNGEEVTYSSAKRLDLPSYGMVQLVSYFARDINSELEKAGGKKMKGWYWTNMPAEELFGDGSGKVVVEGSKGYLNTNYDFFLCSAKVREMWLLDKEEQDED